MLHKRCKKRIKALEAEIVELKQSLEHWKTEALHWQARADIEADRWLPEDDPLFTPEHFKAFMEQE